MPNISFNFILRSSTVLKESSGNLNIDVFEFFNIENLSFRFAGRSQLLKDINLKINKNECIAIVGESGCGKSTLGQIIQKFYPFENGNILVNNTLNLKNLN